MTRIPVLDRPMERGRRARRVGRLVALLLGCATACGPRQVDVGTLRPESRTFPLPPGPRDALVAAGASCADSGALARCTWSARPSRCETHFSRERLEAFACVADGLAYTCEQVAAGYTCAWADDDPSCAVAIPGGDLAKAERLCGAALAAFRSPVPPVEAAVPPVVADGSTDGSAEPLAGVTGVQILGRRLASDALRVLVKAGSPAAIESSLGQDPADALVVSIDGATLTLRYLAPLPANPGPAVTVTVTVPKLLELELLGAADVTVLGFDQQAETLAIDALAGPLSFQGNVGVLSVRNLGSDAVALSGRAAALDARLSGSGAIQASGLIAEMGSAENEGSGGLAVAFDGGPVTLRLLASGDIDWWGSGSVSLERQGSGEIRHHPE